MTISYVYITLSTAYMTSDIRTDFYTLLIWRKYDLIHIYVLLNFSQSFCVLLFNLCLSFIVSCIFVVEQFLIFPTHYCDDYEVFKISFIIRLSTSPSVGIIGISWSWVWLHQKPHDRVSGPPEQRLLVLLGEEITSHIISSTPFHWYLPLLNHIGHKKMRNFYVIRSLTNLWPAIIF